MVDQNSTESALKKLFYSRPRVFADYLLNSGRLAVILLDAEGTILDCNAFFLENSGLAEKPIGLSINTFLQDDQAGALGRHPAVPGAVKRPAGALRLLVALRELARRAEGLEHHPGHDRVRAPGQRDVGPARPNQVGRHGQGVEAGGAAVRDGQQPRLESEAVGDGAAGGVAANTFLRASFEKACGDNGMKLYYPPLKLCTDNAAMIASSGYFAYQQQEFAGGDLNAVPGLKLGERLGNSGSPA